MDEKQRLNLQEMIKGFDADDNTSKIRKLRHSRLIKENVEIMLTLKKKYQRMKNVDPKNYNKILVSKCNFLFNNYTNIFNRIYKDELNINILNHFIATCLNVAIK